VRPAEVKCGGQRGQGERGARDERHGAGRAARRGASGVPDRYQRPRTHNVRTGRPWRRAEPQRVRLADPVKRRGQERGRERAACAHARIGADGQGARAGSACKGSMRARVLYVRTCVQTSGGARSRVEDGIRSTSAVQFIG
jgi:hypothetical protein